MINDYKVYLHDELNSIVKGALIINQSEIEKEKKFLEDTQELK